MESADFLKIMNKIWKAQGMLMKYVLLEISKMGKKIGMN